MSNEVITQDQQHAPAPFGPAAGGSPSVAGLPAINAGAVAIEQQRAVAEAQGKLILAKRFPRDLTASHAELMQSCKSRAFAEVAFYSVPNRGSGPSIRFAEEVARVYGNFDYGHRELSRDADRSEVEVYAWDQEKNNFSRRQLTVFHVVDTKNGPKKLRDQADIDNKIANTASKQVRGRILALMPKWLVQEAIEECKRTLAGNNEEPIAARVRKMTKAFARWGVTPAQIERYLGHGLDETLADELVDLQGVFNALKEGAKPSDYFGGEHEDNSDAESAEESLKASAKAGKDKAAQSKPTKPAGSASKGASPPPKQTKAEPAPQQESKPAKNESKAKEEPPAKVAEDTGNADAPEAGGEPEPAAEQQPQQEAAADESGADLF